MLMLYLVAEIRKEKIVEENNFFLYLSSLWKIWEKIKYN